MFGAFVRFVIINAISTKNNISYYFYRSTRFSTMPNGNSNFLRNRLFFTKQTIKGKLRNLLQRLFRDYHIILVNCVTLRYFS